MKNIAIIPARCGSKGLKDKNIRMMLGKPMLAYTVEAALQSKIFDKIIVSTDSQIYADIARQYGAEVPFLRSAESATDGAGSAMVITEILERLQKIGQKFDNFMLLQPTSPLRNYENIIQAFQLFQTKQADAIVGVCETEHPPLWANILPEDGCLQSFVKAKDSKQRQEIETYYRINGAIYLSKADYYLLNKTFYGEKSFAYIMDKQSSIDIDDETDFMIAETIMKHRKEG